MVAAPAQPNASSANTNRALFAIWGLFWLLMIVVSVEDHSDRRYYRWWEPYLWEGSSCLVATMWLALQRRVATRWNVYLAQPVRWFGRHMAWFPVIAVTFVTLIYAIRHSVYALAHLTYRHDPWPGLFVYETIKLLLFTALWLCIIFGLASFALWREERERLLTLQKDLAESQLAQLRAQLQPHFLFNALNTISSLMQVDVGRADRLVTQLADLLRSSLHTGAQQLTSLREEMKLLELYSDIMCERFAGRVSVTWDIAGRHACCRRSGLAAAAPARKRFQARRRALQSASRRAHRRAARGRRSAGHHSQHRWHPGCRTEAGHWSRELPRATQSVVWRTWPARARAGRGRRDGATLAALSARGRMIRALVVDDEAPARDKLRRWLAQRA